MTDMFDDDYVFPVKADKPCPDYCPSISGEPQALAAESEPGDESEFPAPSGAMAYIVVPDRVEPTLYRLLAEPTWHQRGEECTGFSLAGVANYLGRKNLVERRGIELPRHDGTDWPGVDEETLRAVRAAWPSVSPRMMYEMAQVYDGEDYEEASTLLGALLGWWRCGITTGEMWPYAAGDEHGEVHGGWTVGRIGDARTRQLQWGDGQRQLHASDLTGMKAALANNQVLYVDAEVHAGWFRPLLPGTTKVTFVEGDAMKGFHAFLIVGYDEEGFWVHNSWGRFWGDDGYALLPYEDWEQHGRGVWATTFAGAKPSLCDPDPQLARPELDVAREMWGHVVALDDEGRLSTTGLYESTNDTVRSMFYLFEQRTKEWDRPRLLVFADDGSAPRAEAIEKFAAMRIELMKQQIYPIFVVWDVPWFADLEDELLLRDLDGSVDIFFPTGEEEGDEERFAFWMYELRIARTLAVEMWKAVQDRAARACRPGGGARILAQRISEKARRMDFDLHVASHGAGDFLLAQLVPHLPRITSAELWAPATSIQQYESGYGRVFGRHRLGRLTITVLDEALERADKIGLYPRSVLLLASNVLAVDGIDDADRFPGVPTELPLGAGAEAGAATPVAPEDDVEALLERDFEAGPRPPQQIVGLARCLDEDAANLTGSPARITVEPATGLTHWSLATDRDVLKATMARIVERPEPAPTPPARAAPVPVDEEPPAPIPPRDPVAKALQDLSYR